MHYLLSRPALSRLIVELLRTVRALLSFLIVPLYTRSSGRLQNAAVANSTCTVFSFGNRNYQCRRCRRARVDSYAFVGLSVVI